MGLPEAGQSSRQWAEEMDQILRTTGWFFDRVMGGAETDSGTILKYSAGMIMLFMGGGNHVLWRDRRRGLGIADLQGLGPRTPQKSYRKEERSFPLEPIITMNVTKTFSVFLSLWLFNSLLGNLIGFFWLLASFAFVRLFALYSASAV